MERSDSEAGEVSRPREGDGLEGPASADAVVIVDWSKISQIVKRGRVQLHATHNVRDARMLRGRLLRAASSVPWFGSYALPLTEQRLRFT